MPGKIGRRKYPISLCGCEGFQGLENKTEWARCEPRFAVRPNECEPDCAIKASEETSRSSLWSGVRLGHVSEEDIQMLTHSGVNGDERVDFSYSSPRASKSARSFFLPMALLLAINSFRPM